MIYLGIFLVINAALIFCYFKYLNLSGKKRLIIFALGLPTLNILSVSLLLLIFHGQYKAEFNQPVAYIEYQIVDELKQDPTKSYQRSVEVLNFLKQHSDISSFRKFDLAIDVNKSQEFIVDDIYKASKQLNVKELLPALLADPLAVEKAYFACLPNVTKGKLPESICGTVNYEEAFAAYAKVILLLGMQGQEHKSYLSIVERVSGLFQMQDALAGSDVGASYQDDFFKYKLRFFNLAKILVTHYKVKKKFKQPLRKMVKKLFPRDKEANIKRWRYVNVIFDQHMRQLKVDLLKRAQVPLMVPPKFKNWKEYWKIYQSEFTSLSNLTLRYLLKTGTLGFLINTEEHLKQRETYIKKVLFFIKRKSQFTKVDMEFEARRAVSFERNNFEEVLKKHLFKNKPLLNFYGRYQYFDFMKSRGFQAFRKIWEVEFFLEEAVDFVAD